MNRRNDLSSAALAPVLKKMGNDILI